MDINATTWHRAQEYELVICPASVEERTYRQKVGESIFVLCSVIYFTCKEQYVRREFYSISGDGLVSEAGDW